MMKKVKECDNDLQHKPKETGLQLKKVVEESLFIFPLRVELSFRLPVQVKEKNTGVRENIFILPEGQLTTEEKNFGYII